MEKMEAAGAPLRDWDISIFRGLLTGYNAAFIIDNDTRKRLVTEDPRSADIIKRILRGRDIERYSSTLGGYVDCRYAQRIQGRPTDPE